MAVSQSSRTFQLNRPIETIDLGFTAETIGTQQDKLDQNYGLINNSLKRISELDLIKPEDIAYRDRKLSAMTSQLNDYGNIDLSDPKVSAKLQLEAESITRDQKLMGMLQSTANYRQLVSRYAKMKENPKLMPFYSDINEAHDMKQASNWLNTSGTTLSTNSPTFYVDVDKKIGEVLKSMNIQKSSTVQGMYIVNGEVKSASDLQALAISQIQNNPSVAAQLKRNADAIYENLTPAQIYERSVQKRDALLNETNRNILEYRTKLLDPSLSLDEKAAIKSSVEQYESGIPEYSIETERLRNLAITGEGNPQEVENLRYNLYTTSYVEGVVKPYVVSNRSIKADPVGMLGFKENSHYNTELMKQQHNDARNALDNQTTIQKELIEAQTQYNKLGSKVNTGEYDASGKLINTSGGPSPFIQQPVIQPDGDIDAVGDANQKIDSLYTSNKQLLIKGVIDYTRLTDTEMATKLERLHNTVGIKGQRDKNMSVGLIKVLNDLDKRLDSASDPNLMVEDASLPQYATVADQITTNMLQANSLKNEVLKAKREVFEEEWKGKNKGMSWESFIKATEFKNAADVKGVQAGAIYIPTEVNRGNDYTKRINQKLSKSTLSNEFLTKRVIADDDKIFNDGFVPKKALELVELGVGITENGVNYSINGKRGLDKVYRDNIDGVTKVKIDALIPNTNQVQVTMFGEIDGKPVQLKKGVMDLNPTQFESLTGVQNNVVRSIQPMLIDGVMKDQNNKPLYFNLNNKVPNMVGNMKYRFYDSGRGDRSLGMTLAVPINGKMIDVNLKDGNGKPFIFEGEAAHLEGAQKLSKFYTEAYDFVGNLPESKGLSHAELSKKTLEYIYKSLNGK